MFESAESDDADQKASGHAGPGLALTWIHLPQWSMVFPHEFLTQSEGHSPAVQVPSLRHLAGASVLAAYSTHELHAAIATVATRGVPGWGGRGVCMERRDRASEGTWCHFCVTIYVHGAALRVVWARVR